MRVIKDDKIDYKDFLESIKFMVEKKTLGYIEKNRLIKTIDFLVDLDDIEKQNFILQGFKKIDEQINRYVKNDKLSYFKLYDSACCLFELVKDNYEHIKDFTPDEIVCLTFFLWPFDENSKKEYAPLVFNKQICSEIVNKFPNKVVIQKELYGKVLEEYDITGNCEGFVENSINIIRRSTEEELNKRIEKRNMQSDIDLILG